MPIIGGLFSTVPLMPLYEQNSASKENPTTRLSALILDIAVAVLALF